MLARLLPLLILVSAFALPVQAQKGDVFTAVDNPPELIGGVQGLVEQVRYPAAAEAAGAEGTVVVQFVVDERGAVTEASVVRSVTPELDAEALRVVQAAAFRPGSHDGQPARVRLTMPVKFVLGDAPARQ